VVPDDFGAVNIMAGLQNPFVQIKELGDFSISYRIAGFLPDVKHILTSRSDLRKLVVDMLHGDGIEIVSPNFMNQRVLPEHLKVNNPG
jgi:small-conductance mechanosensitive channel